MGSQIQITFTNDNATFASFVEFEIYQLGTIQLGQILRESWEIGAIRTQAFLIPLASYTPTTTPGQATAEAFAYWWNLDYNGVNAYQVSTLANVVTIEKITPVGVDCIKGFRNFSTNITNASAEINNCTENAQGIVEVLYNPDLSQPCSIVGVSIETNELAETVKLNGTTLTTTNTLNPFLYDLTRGVLNRFELVGATGSVFYPAQNLPEINIRLLSPNDIVVNVIPSVSGATVNFIITPLNGENPIPTYQYSLDGINYQASNAFTGQTNNSYTVFVKDSWNCVIQKDYIVTDSGTRLPYLFISQANSLIFAENENVDDCTIFRNDHNSLANQSLSDIVYCAENIYKPCDTITLQFKSNYDNPKVYIRFEDGSEDEELTLIQQTSNLNRFQYLDSFYYEYQPGKLGLYFLSGNIYDETGLPIGTFDLNGNVPDFAIVGQIITIDSLGTFIVNEIVFDSTIQRKVIVVDYVFPTTVLPTPTRVKSIFDILPYEIYEFTIDWSIYGAGLYDVLISNQDTFNPTVEYLSENVFVQEDIGKQLAIKYFNANNRDIFYKFGIKNFIRIGYLRIEGITVQDEKINITDLTSNLVDSSVTNGNKFYFEAVSKKVMRQMVIALSCENVFINGVGYIKNGEIATSNIEGTNLYNVTAEMINTNINYTNNRQGQTGYSSDYIDFNIPAFIDLDGNGLLTT